MSHGYRTGRSTRHGLAAQLRRSVYSRLAGYEDTTDDAQLRNDPAMRRVVGGRAQGPALGSTSQIPPNIPNSTDQRSRVIIRSRDLPSSVAEPGPELKE
ncbi:MAG: transposase [SAR324 cluster bacterium]|nr:transposase [SAR324 cluster bacterium]